VALLSPGEVGDFQVATTGGFWVAGGGWSLGSQSENDPLNNQLAVEKWKAFYARDNRFKSFLSELAGTYSVTASKYSLKETTYQSMGLDAVTCPIRVNPKEGEDPIFFSPNLRPGILALEGGHAYTVYRCNNEYANTIWCISSTVPSERRVLACDPLHSYTWLNEFARWNWVINCGEGYTLLDDEKMPNYDTQSLQEGETQNFLKGKTETLHIDEINLIKNSITAKTKSRLDLVNNSIKRRPTIDLNDPKARASFIDAYSTENRDLRYLGVIVDTLIQISNAGHNEAKKLAEALDKRITFDTENQLKTTPRLFYEAADEIIKQALPDEGIRDAFLRTGLSDPFASRIQRWGWCYIDKKARETAKLLSQTSQGQALADEQRAQLEKDLAYYASLGWNAGQKFCNDSNEKEQHRQAPGQ
jgi:hypothetical protein